MQRRWDPTFSEHSYGFRPGRSANQAVAQAQRYVAEGYNYVVDIDLEKFFDRVNHDILMAALLYAFIITLPSVLLSGFWFPRSQMRFEIYLLTFCLPVTHYIEIIRGIVLRGAGLRDVWDSVLCLSICLVVILSLAVFRFRKRLSKRPSRQRHSVRFAYYPAAAMVQSATIAAHSDSAVYPSHRE